MRSGLVRVAIVIVVLITVGGALSACSPDPEATYRDVVKAAEDGEWGKVYDAYDKKSQGQVDAGMQVLSGLASLGGGETQATFEGKQGRDLFIAVAEFSEPVAEAFKAGDFEVTDKTVKGDEATLEIKRGDGEAATIRMLKEDGKWCLTAGEMGAAASDDSSDAESSSPENQARTDALSEALALTVSEKTFLPANTANMEYTDYIALDLELENNSEKDISGVKGDIIFRDMFGDEVITYQMSYDRPIPASETVTSTWQWQFNTYAANEVKLKDTPLEKLTIEWVPDTIVYEDGTTLSASE